MPDGALAPKLSRREWYPAATASSLEQESLLSTADVNPAPSTAWGIAQPGPDWADAVNAQIARIASLTPDWDTFGSPPPNPNAVAAAVELLREVMPLGLPIPRVVATAECGVTIEWFTSAVEFVIELDEGGRSAVVMFRDRITGDCTEGAIEDQPDVVSKAIHRLQVGF